VIGGIIAFPDECDEAFRLLTPEMFSNSWTAKVFSVCKELHQTGSEPDIVMVESRVGQEHRAKLTKCVAMMPSHSGFADYCAAVLENWRRRELAKELQQLAMESFPAGQTVEAMERILARQRAIDQGLSDRTAVDFWAAVMRYMDQLIRPNTAIQSGWRDFDLRTGGLQRKGFYIISARSGMGKTDFALAMATNIASRRRVTYCSMEMPVEQLMERVASRMAHVNSDTLRDHSLTPEDLRRVTGALGRIQEETKLTIDEQRRLSVEQLENKVIRQRPEVLFIDHVGLMEHDRTRKNLWEAIAATSQRLKELAGRHNIVVVALVQEGRGAVNGKVSNVNLKGSDNLTNDADGIFQISAEHPENPLRGEMWLDTEIHVTKNRHGGTGKLIFHWQPQYHSWTPVEQRY